MIFTLTNFKSFLKYIKHNQIKQINIQDKNLNISINKSLETTYPKNIEVSKNLQYHSNHDLDIPDKLIKSDTHITLKTNESKDSNIYSTIISPMVGTFYRSPAPNEAPFIEKGDIVQKKQIVCIIEAMKLMNEIEAEVNGEITEILVQDGDIVDCGQALMKVKLT
uniref:Biotin carboxyl carrier protein of acetyl-CoA carboxylase n=1 Tax=Wrangelia sp. TaxID=2575620 RepID=A0A4D6WZ78_9FLOR|nr:acetyl-CoA carboxylase, biotin carboxyl carrier protein [Wrangelia sp.]